MHMAEQGKRHTLSAARAGSHKLHKREARDERHNYVENTHMMAAHSFTHDAHTKLTLKHQEKPKSVCCADTSVRLAIGQRSKLSCLTDTVDNTFLSTTLQHTQRHTQMTYLTWCVVVVLRTQLLNHSGQRGVQSEVRLFGSHVVVGRDHLFGSVQLRGKREHDAQ